MQIYNKGLLSPKYTWITYGWYAQASWINTDLVNCTQAQLRRALDNGISIEEFPIPEDVHSSTVAGLVSIQCY
jgi:hypothetical protein